MSGPLSAPIKPTMRFSGLVQRFLPQPFYTKLAGSTIAKRIVSGSLWSFFGSGISRVLVLVAMILTARILGQVSFGELGLIQTTLGIFGTFAGVAIGSTATRFVAQFSVSDPARGGRIIALVTASSIVTVIVASAILIALSGILANTVMEAPHLRTAIFWGVLLMAVSAFRGVQNSIFAGLERFDIAAKLNIMEGIIALPAIIFLARLFGLHGALIGFAVSAMIIWAAGRLLLTAELRAKDIAIRYQGCLNDWRVLPNYSFPKLLASSLSTPVIWLAMVLIARSDEGFAALGLYNAAYQWVGPLIFVPMILSTVSISVLVQEWEADRVQRFRRIFLGLVLFALGAILSVASIIAFLSPWIMRMYGPGFEEGWLSLAILAIATPFIGVGNISSNALFSMNKPWNEFFIMVVWGITLIVITLCLVERWGVLALAASFLIAHILRAVSGCASVLLNTRWHRKEQFSK